MAKKLVEQPKELRTRTDAKRLAAWAKDAYKRGAIESTKRDLALTISKQWREYLDLAYPQSEPTRLARLERAYQRFLKAEAKSLGRRDRRAGETTTTVVSESKNSTRREGPAAKEVSTP